MTLVVNSKHDDEIADVVERVKSAAAAEGDGDIALVVPDGSRAFQTPLNARLLSQFTKQLGRRVVMVSGEPRVQELARSSGFPIYASLTALERGVEVVAPMAPRTPTAYAGGGTALAVASPPPSTATRAPDRWAAQTRAGGGGERRRVLPGGPDLRLPGTRRAWYFAGAAVAVVGIILFLLLSPTATITVTVAATPLSVNATIQGSPDATAAVGGDHILTSVVSSTGSSNFQATPTGQKTLPATAATATEVISTTYPDGIQGTIPAGTQFQSSDSAHSLTFGVTHDTYVCVAPTGSPPPSGCTNNGQHAQPNSQLPVQDETPEAKGNVAAGTLTYWPTSQQPTLCQPSPPEQIDLCSATNPAATSGGADSKQVTVASSGDVSNWTQQVQQIEHSLTNQVTEDMKGKAGGKTIAQDPNGGGKSIAFTVNPALPSAGDQFSPTQITISANASAAVYDPASVRNDVLSDLKAQVPQGDQLGADKLSIQPVNVTQAATDGTVILSVSATGFSQPVVDLAGLKKQLSGKNPGDAQKIIEGRIDKVQSVKVSEFPFPLFYLPFFSSRIEINENFVATPRPS